jgi:hypothetical protein
VPQGWHLSVEHRNSTKVFQTEKMASPLLRKEEGGRVGECRVVRINPTFGRYSGVRVLNHTTAAVADYVLVAVGISVRHGYEVGLSPKAVVRVLLHGRPKECVLLYMVVVAVVMTVAVMTRVAVMAPLDSKGKLRCTNDTSTVGRAADREI